MSYDIIIVNSAGAQVSFMVISYIKFYPLQLRLPVILIRFTRNGAFFKLSLFENYDITSCDPSSISCSATKYMHQPFRRIEAPDNT